MGLEVKTRTSSDFFGDFSFIESLYWNNYLALPFALRLHTVRYNAPELGYRVGLEVTAGGIHASQDTFSSFLNFLLQHNIICCQ